jgi:C1A family cysteine protease
LIEGYLFAFGMSVYSNFESSETENTGILHLPSKEDVYKGGHAVCAVGFDDVKSVFIVRNSWGDQWGDHGYFYLPYDYMLDKNLVYDIWAFRNGAETFTLTIETKEKKKSTCTIT